MGRKKNIPNLTKAKIGLAIIIASFFLIIVYYSYINIDIRNIPMKVKVDEVIGINVNASALDFGRTYPDSLAYRKINLTNNYGFPVRVEIYNTGEIAPLVSVSENNFVLNVSEFRQVTYYVKIPKFYGYRSYDGNTRIFFKRKL